MTYTARELITRSYYLSKIVAKKYQILGGGQIQDGLELLNEVLDWKSCEISLLPFYKNYSFITNTNDTEYFIENLFSIESLTFDLTSSFRVPSQRLTRTEFFASAKPYNVNTFPVYWTENREKNGTKIFFYFRQNQNYVINLTGKFGLLDVELEQDLSLVYDKGYLVYLKYVLASYMCDSYGGVMSEGSLRRLESMERTLNSLSPPDVTFRMKSAFSKGASITLYDVNVLRGYRPC